MSIFDSFKPSVAPQFSIQQAMMTIVVAAIKADGQVSQEELMRIKAMCSISPIFASNTGDQDAALVSFADNVTTQLGTEAIAQAAHVLTQELRETAFAFACDMVLADGILTQVEENYLNSLVSQLGVNNDAARTVIWATLIRNRAT